MAFLHGLVSPVSQWSKLCLLGVLDAFKSVEQMSLDWSSGKIEDSNAFNEQFFGSLALRGVRACDMHADDYHTVIAACEFLNFTGGIECCLFLELEDYSPTDDFDDFLVVLLQVCVLMS